jgi:hypothetical protein
MNDECPHLWTEALACRTCQSIDVVEVPLESDFVITPAGFRIKTEPLYGYFCGECDDLTMASPSRHCLLCGVVEWRRTTDEEILDQ